MKLFFSLFFSIPVLLNALTLDNVVEAGIKNNFTLKAKKTDIEYFRSKLEEVKTQVGLNINMDANFGRTNADTEYERFNRVQQQYTSYGYGISVGKPIINMKNYRQQDRAYNDINRVEVEYQLAVQDIILKITDAYLDVLTKKDLLASMIKKYEYIKSKNEDVQKRFNSRMATKQDALFASASLSKADSDVAASRNNLKYSLANLSAIVGIEVNDVSRVEENCIDVVENIEQLEKFIDSATKNFLGIVKTEYIINGYYADVKSITSEIYPTIDIYAQARKNNTDDVIYGRSNSSVYYGGINFRWNIYDAGSLSTRKTSYVLLAKENEFMLAQSRKDTAAQVTRVYYQVKNSYRQYRAEKELYNALAVSLKSTEKSYQYSLSSIIDLFESKSKLDESMVSYKKAVYSTIASIMQLKYYSGSLNFDDILIVKYSKE